MLLYELMLQAGSARERGGITAQSQQVVCANLLALLSEIPGMTNTCGTSFGKATGLNGFREGQYANPLASLSTCKERGNVQALRKGVVSVGILRQL